MTDLSDAGYPEQNHPAQAPLPSTGVCFSGGSTRSYAATIGQLRGLTETGLIRRVGYLSAVSAGAWAATAYTFYPDGEDVRTDAEIVGSHVEPQALSLERLSELHPRSLGSAATSDFARALDAAKADRSVARDETWTRAVGETFLAPYGLYDHDESVSFTLNASTAKAIHDRNPILRGGRLHTVRRATYRPYLLIHSTLNWPDDEPDPERVKRVGFEYSPLGAGCAARLILRLDDRPSRVVGGGFVEPFAFGSAAPRHPVGADRCVALELPQRPFTLADAVGASSAFSTPNRDLQTYPHALYWPIPSPLDGSDTMTTRDAFSDGGDLENYGLLALLRRQVRAIIVFVNSVWPLSLDYAPVRWPADINQSHPESRELDPFLAPLFGAPSEQFRHNHVFPQRDYATVVAGLQSAKRRGGPVVMTTRHTVLPNEWWGIEGGTEVRVCWVYNDHVERWVERLPDRLCRVVRQGMRPNPAGPFAHFPHYLTRGQNAGALIRLTPSQVNLLSHLSCWNVVESQAALRDLLEGT